VVRMKEKVK